MQELTKKSCASNTQTDTEFWYFFRFHSINCQQSSATVWQFVAIPRYQATTLERSHFRTTTRPATILDLTNWQQRSGTGWQLTNEYYVTGDYYGERSHLTSWHWATNDDWLTYVPGHYCGERRLQRETGFGAQPHFGAILGGFGVQSGAILGARLNWAEDCWTGEYRGPSVVGRETCMEWCGKSCC